MSTIITIGAWGIFMGWVAHHKIEELLWKRDERRAERFLLMQPVPPAPEPEPVVPGWEPLDEASFKRGVEEWGGLDNVTRAFADIFELDLYWAEDWELGHEHRS